VIVWIPPSHFLIGRPAGFQVEIEKDSLDSPQAVVAKDLGAWEAVRQAKLDSFWNMWSDDYLRNLHPVAKGFEARCNLKVGSVVLIREDHVPHLSWPLGVVEEMFPGRDGIVRSVSLKTATGKLTRAVQRLHELEVSGSLYKQNLTPGSVDLGTSDTVDSDESVQLPSKEGPSVVPSVVPNVVPIVVPTPRVVKTSRRGRPIKPVKRFDL
jgi:hypothetical protein